MIKWLNISDTTKRNAYEQIAVETRMSAFAVEKDWWVRKEDMIYEVNAPNFEELINNLNELKVQLQNLDWKFDLKFSIPNF